MGGSVELSQKLSVFTDPLKTFSVEQLAVYVSLGYELGLVPAGGGGVGMMYVDRGDPVAADKTEADLVADGTWRQVSLAAVLPTNAKFVQLRLGVTAAGGANFLLACREKGNVNAANAVAARTFIAAVATDACGIIPVGADGIIEYLLSAGTTCYINVLGWFI